MLLERLHDKVASGELRPDPLQRAAAERLDRLARELEAYHPAPPKPANGGGFLAWFGLARGSRPRRHPSASTSTAASAAASRC